jgi:hypothetical protein
MGPSGREKKKWAAMTAALGFWVEVYEELEVLIP